MNENVWMPISSAPTDGRFILAYGKPSGRLPPLGDYEFAVVHWLDGAEGWYFDGDEYTFAPTHWMPVPNGPTP